MTTRGSGFAKGIGGMMLFCGVLNALGQCCIALRYRSAATGITGCMAFLMGSLAPVVLGWMSMPTGIASLGAFYLLGAAVPLPVMVWFFKRDQVEG